MASHKYLKSAGLQGSSTTELGVGAAVCSVQVAMQFMSRSQHLGAETFQGSGAGSRNMVSRAKGGDPIAQYTLGCWFAEGVCACSHGQPGGRCPAALDCTWNKRALLHDA